MKRNEFRAWDKIEKKMYEVESINFSKKEAVVRTVLEVDMGIPPKVRSFTDIVFMQWTGIYDDVKWDFINTYEREQWIKACNKPEDWPGRKVFEGDGVEYWRGQPARVEFVEGGYILRGVESGQYELLGQRVAEIRVIGNVWENPEFSK